MTDPFAEVRELADSPVFVQGPNDLKLVRDLIADTDALLAVKRELEPHAKDAYIEDFGDWYDDDFWRAWLGRNYPALAALPEHLK